jgi:flotillin
MPNVVAIFIGLGVVVLLIIMTSIAKMFRKAGPNEAIIVYGFRGPRIIKGSGAVIFPMIESCRQLSLELMSFDVAPQQDISSRES